MKWTLRPTSIEELSRTSEMGTEKNAAIQMDSYSDFLKGILKYKWLKQIPKEDQSPIVNMPCDTLTNIKLSNKKY